MVLTEHRKELESTMWMLEERSRQEDAGLENLRRAYREQDELNNALGQR